MSQNSTLKNDISAFFHKEKGVFYREMPVWYYLGNKDVKERFRGSNLGVLWLVLHQLAFSFGGGYIWAHVFNIDPGEFIPFLTVGFVCWGFITNSLTEGCAVFVNAHGYLRQLPLSQSLFVFRAVYVQGIYLLIGLGAAVMILLLFGKLSVVGLLIALPGVALLYLAGYFTVGLCAYLGIRFRDLQHAIGVFLPLLFVVTPVIYPPEVLVQKGVGIFVYGNPFSAFIEIVRYPLLHGEPTHGINYVIVTACIGVLFIARVKLQSRWSAKVPFWV